MAKPNKKTFAVFGAPLSGNKGSASMVWGLRDGLMSAGADVHLVVYSYYPKKDRMIAESYENITVFPGHPIHLLPLMLTTLLGRLFPFFRTESARSLLLADAALMVGGTTFADSKWFKTPWNVLAMLPAWIGGRKIFFLSQTLGPFENFFNRSMARFSLSRANYIFGRGEISTNNVRSLGYECVEYGPDLSFAMSLAHLTDQESLDQILDEINSAARGRKSVGVTPNTIVDAAMKNVGMDYSMLMAAVVSEIAERGYLPVIIPHSYRDSGHGAHNNDTHLCKQIISQLPEGLDYYFVSEDLTSQSLRVLVADLHFLVASRFHSMISALDRGVPVLTLGWGNQKYIEVLDVYRLGNLYVDYADASFQILRKKMSSIESNRKEIDKCLANGNEINQTRLTKSFQKILNL